VCTLSYFGYLRVLFTHLYFVVEEQSFKESELLACARHCMVVCPCRGFLRGIYLWDQVEDAMLEFRKVGLRGR
jgi:hypothetical protein